MSDSYLQQAIEDAKDAALYFQDEIVESYLDGSGNADEDLYDYDNGDSYHHENYVDKSYSLLEAAELLDELSDYEETDEGLWFKQMPREAISTQAAYTYGNAVLALFRDLIERINDDDTLTDFFVDYEQIEDTVQAEWDAAEDKWKAEMEKTDDDETCFEEPFDVADETGVRKENVLGSIRTLIGEIINAFTG